MRVLSLFSGGGLGDYGLTLAGMEIVGQVEIDDYCQKILSIRWPEVPKWKDIRDVRGKEVIERCGTVDLVSGGFPCQPFSFAGKRKGEEDDRNLWPEMSRIISEIRPAWVLAENVLGVLGFIERFVLPDLEALGFEVLPPIIFPAHALGAPHRRERVWIVANSRHHGRSSQSWEQQKARPEVANSSCQGNVAFPTSPRLEKRKKSGKMAIRGTTAGTERSSCGQNFYRSGFKQWAIEPNVGRVAHGVPNRVDRLKLLGNGQVVQVVEWIGRRILEFDKGEM